MGSFLLLKRSVV